MVTTLDTDMLDCDAIYDFIKGYFRMVLSVIFLAMCFQTSYNMVNEL